MNKYLFVLMPLLFSANAASAAKISIDDLLGRWCGVFGDYRFEKDRLDVSFHSGGSKTLGIRKIDEEEGGRPGLNIWWADGGSTIFRLEQDNRLLVQLTKVDESGGPISKTPRREFRRCQ